MKFQDMIGLSSYYFNFKGGKEMISYYELLGMIKENNIPEKVKYDDNTYIWNGRNYHTIEADNRPYLNSDIDEVDMIKRNIEIIEPKKIEKLKLENGHIAEVLENGDEHWYTISSAQRILASKINEIIEVLNEKEKIQDNKK